MKKQRQVIKKDPKKDAKKPKNIKKDKKKNHEQDNQDFDQIDQMDSFSDIYDSNEQSFTQSFDQGDENDAQGEDQIDSLDEFGKQVEKECESQKQYKNLEFNLKGDDYTTQKKNLNPIEEEIQEKNTAENEQIKKKFEEMQKIRLEKYLKKPVINSFPVSIDQTIQSKIKLESQQTYSIAPEPSQFENEKEQSELESEVTTMNKVKSDFVLRSTQSKPECENPAFFSYLVNIMNGNVTAEQLQKRRKEEERQKKIEDKIKELQKRKIQQKIKKQFDARSDSEMKVLSTNMDSVYGKDENESYRMPLKSEGDKSRSKLELRPDGEAQDNGRKKRTRVTTQMLKEILKLFQIVAKQQNGLLKGDKLTFKEIGKKFRLGRSSVMKMYSDYCKDPTMKTRFDNKQPMAHNRTMMELTKRRITFVQKLIKKDCTLSQRQIAAEMNSHQDLKCKRKRKSGQTLQEYNQDPYHPIAYKAVSRLMKLGNFTRKKVTLIPKNRNSDRTLEERYHFCQILSELVADDNNKLYYLDECRFNLFTSRDWGWAPKGQLATKVRHNSKGKDVMLLAIIGKEGLIGYEVSDSYNRGSFTIAIQKLINSIIPQVVPQGQKIYLILDNCPIHNKECLKDMESKKPLTVLYLPPYSPMLNPIESWFGELKRVVKSKIYKTRQAMKAQLIRVLETFRNKSMENYYKGINKYIDLGLKKVLYRGNNKI